MSKKVVNINSYFPAKLISEWLQETLPEVSEDFSIERKEYYKEILEKYIHCYTTDLLESIIEVLEIIPLVPEDLEAQVVELKKRLINLTKDL